MGSWLAEGKEDEYNQWYDEHRTADMVMTEAIDMKTLSAPVFLEITPEILAQNVQRPRRA